MTIELSARDHPELAIGAELRGDARSSMPISFASARPCTVLIEERTLLRECILSSLQAMDPGHNFKAFESVAAWAQNSGSLSTSLLILWMSAPPMETQGDDSFDDRLRQVLGLPNPPPVAVMSDHESADCVAHVMHSGARAFLPASMGVGVTVKVMALVRAGGTFIPATALSKAVTAGGNGEARASELAKLLSPRQLAIARAIRKGLPNKLIAYELAMRESTVKVHVKAIMRKLNARNRTEVALLTRSLDADAPEPGWLGS